MCFQRSLLKHDSVDILSYNKIVNLMLKGLTRDKDLKIKLQGDHSFSTYAKFPEKLTFLTL